MHSTFVVQSKYEHLKPQLEAVVKNFNEVGESVAQQERNVIKKVVLQDMTLNIKSFKKPSLFQGLVYHFLRKSKARRSFEYAKRLIEKQINTPFPVAYFENTSFGLKESYYISIHLAYDFDFRVLNHNPNWPNRKEILEQFAVFTFQLHQKGINFLDHSPGNTLIIQNEKGHYDFYLIDLNRMRFEFMNFNKRMHNLRRLWLSKTMINTMAPVYARCSGNSFEETHQLMTFHSRKFQKKVNSKKIRKRRRKH